MRASLLQRRPDLGDRAAGALLGAGVGALLAEEAAGDPADPLLGWLRRAARAAPAGEPPPPPPADLPPGHLAAVTRVLGPALSRLGDPDALGREVGERLGDREVPGAAAALAAVRTTPVPSDPAARHLAEAMTALLAAGAPGAAAPLAGLLLGARWGATAVPFAWRRSLAARLGPHRGQLLRLGLRAVAGGGGTDESWPLAPMLAGAGSEQAPFLAELPGDPGVLLGNLASLPAALDRVEAVVSLCRVDERAVPAGVEHHEVLLVDRADRAANPNLALVLADTGGAIATLRAEDRRVLLHCLAGRSRMPTVAAAHLARRDGLTGTEAFARVAARLPHPQTHNRAFQRALADLAVAPTRAEGTD